VCRSSPTRLDRRLDLPRPAFFPLPARSGFGVQFIPAGFQYPIPYLGQRLGDLP